MATNAEQACRLGLGALSATQSCLQCQVRKLSLFDDLTPDEMAILNKDRSLLEYEPGEYIYKEGSKPFGLYCLSKGKVKIELKSVNGSTQIIALKRPSDFVGFADLMSQPGHTSSAIALEHCTLCFIPKDGFMRVLQSNNAFSIKLIKFLSSQLLQTHHRTANLTQKHMRARLAEAIIYVFEKYQIKESGYVINAKLKRSELAALSNMTTANAIRTLSEFAQDQLVEVRGRKIAIKDLSALRRISLLG